MIQPTMKVRPCHDTLDRVSDRFRRPHGVCVVRFCRRSRRSPALSRQKALERLHKETKRRTRVVGISPSRDSLMRMVGPAR